MRKLFCKLTLTCLAIVCVFAGQVNAATLTGGNDPIAAPLEDGDTIYGSGILLGFSEKLINETGTITSWDIYAAADRIGSQVELVIFDASGVVGRSAMEQPTVAGLNTFTASIAVHAGDGIGFYAPAFNPIEYSDGGTFVSYSVNNGGVPLNNSGVPFDHHVYRTYSIDVHGVAFDSAAVPEPSTALLFGFGGVSLAIQAYRKRRATAV